MDAMHKKITGDVKSTWKNTQDYGKRIIKVFRKKK
jgi:hypothetical protein